MRIAQYELVDELGHGGFGTVYRARDIKMGREVALKVIAGNLSQEPDFAARFRQEVQIAASLRHPRIVPVYDLGQADDGTLYLAMALIQGRTLRRLLDERKRLTLEQALPILAQLAEALDYLQERGLVHRDVKPANVMIEREERDLAVALTDFGLVRSLKASTQLTKSDSLLGTPAYMAPEQADPAQWGEITPLTDVYALGVMAYEMLVGRTPFVGELATVLHAQAYEQPAPPLELAPDLGADLADVLLRALRKLPAERYPDAATLVAALRQVAETRARQQAQRQELVQLLEKALAARQVNDWLALQSLCVQVMQIDRTHPDALTMMLEAAEGLKRESAEEAVRRQRVRRYEAGERALAASQWKEAIAAFEEVAAGNPDFREVQNKLGQARDELRRAQLYDEAIAYAEANRWAEACRTWVNVLRGRLDYHDGDAAARFLDAADSLLNQFDRQQHELDRVRGALALYDALASAMDTRYWKYAAKVGEQLVALAPDLKCPPSWLANAKREMERQAMPGQGRMVWKKDGKEMMCVSGGEFLYGEGKEKVTLPEFWIDRTLVTNAEYARFVADTGHESPEHWKEKTPPEELVHHPVVNVSWEDAAAYAGWAGKRLPTDREWEKAARGTDGREYPWGAWEKSRCNSSEAGVGGTTPVGQYSPQGDSPYGCADMSGNVWEWTASDCGQGRKVLRGGSWFDYQMSARAASRSDITPDNRGNLIGFRCVVELER